MKNIKIKLLGPYKIFDENQNFILNQNLIDQAGIYFWTVKINEEHLINYVGVSSKSIKDRLLQHIKCFLSGDYDIYETSDLEKGILNKIYVPNEDYSNYIKNIERNLKSVLENLRVFNFFYAPLQENKYLLELIESEIIKIVRDGNDKTRLILSNYRLSRLKSEQLNIELNFFSESKILGLPSKILL